ncbi:hypothetical protein [Litorisediminicola beolgyonensis]|uniref:Uncharacterized protein n=1 Tax=Litorisediminicola beolgyonensis TaxID=1173614 RepID=A0ABW3ZNF1_9RHOB
MSDIYQNARESLSRVQAFEPEKITREKELGSYAFASAVEPARKLVSLFQRVPLEALSEFPDQTLRQIQSAADGAFALLEEARAFDPDEGSIRDRQSAMPDKLSAAYTTHFATLQPHISYSVARTIDFAKIEAEGRAAIQAAKDLKDRLGAEMLESKAQAEQLLADVKKLAKEQGVTQQAIYFQEEAKLNDELAKKWLFASVAAVVVTLGYTISLFFVSHLEQFSPARLRTH